jgi:hypothetical protein
MYTTRRLTLEQLEPVIREVGSLEQPSGKLVNHRVYLESSKDYMSGLLGPMAAEYNREFQWPHELQVFKRLANLKLEDYWVNFMGPGACTPIHNHGGCLSWCLWLRVPYTRQAELAATPWIPEGNNINGDFAFHTVTDRGIKTIPLNVDLTWEGVLAMWPAYLHHSVFPYYSTDLLRVSVAGNFWFDV